MSRLAIVLSLMHAKSNCNNLYSVTNSFVQQAQIRVIPAARVVSVGEALPIPWWAIFVSVLAAVIIITVIAVLLWVVSPFSYLS